MMARCGRGGRGGDAGPVIHTALAPSIAADALAPSIAGRGRGGRGGCGGRGGRGGRGGHAGPSIHTALALSIPDALERTLPTPQQSAAVLPITCGYEVGEKLYFTGISFTSRSGTRWLHGEQCEVVGPATIERYMSNGLEVQFEGSKRPVPCYLKDLSRVAPAPPAAAETKLETTQTKLETKVPISATTEAPAAATSQHQQRPSRSARRMPAISLTDIEWTCPVCAMSNSGERSECLGCGGPSPRAKGLLFDFDERAQQLRRGGCELPADLAARACNDGFTAHTILVLDNSGSMRSRDVQHTRNKAVLDRRCDALLNVLKEQLIKRQIAEGATPSDRVSLIKMESLEVGRDNGVQAQVDSSVRMPFALMPLDASLVARLESAMHSRARGHCFYLPAIARLCELVHFAAACLSSTAITNVLFFSDGRPSDWDLAGPGQDEAHAALHQEMKRLLETDPRMRVKFLGFGDPTAFALLKAMADALPGDAGELFECSSTNEAELGRTITAFSSKVAISRLSSVSAVFADESRRLRPSLTSNVLLAKRFQRYTATMFMAPPAGDFNGQLKHAGAYTIEISVGKLFHNDVEIGTGGERNVFNMHFVEDNGFCKAADQWVVKENRHEERDENEELHFHRTNLVTQMTAMMFADRFNELAKRLELKNIPTISFMTCCFIRTDTPTKRDLFAERHIGYDFRKVSSRSSRTHDE